MGKRFGSEPVKNLFDSTDPVVDSKVSEFEREGKALVKANIPKAHLITYLQVEGNEKKHILKKDGHFTQHFFKFFLNIAGRDYDRLNGINVSVLNDANQSLLDATMEKMESLDTNVKDEVREESLVKGYMDKNANLIKDIKDLNTNLQESAHIISDQVEALKEFIGIFTNHICPECEEEGIKADLTEDTIKMIEELVK